MLVAENLESDFYFTSGHRPAIARSHFDSHLTALDTLATHMGPSHRASEASPGRLNCKVRPTPAFCCASAHLDLGLKGPGHDLGPAS